MCINAYSLNGCVNVRVWCVLVCVTVWLYVVPVFLGEVDACLRRSRRHCKQASKQTQTHISTAGRQASKQASKQAGRQADRQAMKTNGKRHCAYFHIIALPSLSLS